MTAVLVALFHLPADENLQRPDYVSIVCGSIENLPEAFAGIDRTGAIDPAEIHLIRDHRDSDLDRLVKQLLEQHPSPEGARLPPPGWEPCAHAEAFGSISRRRWLIGSKPFDLSDGLPYRGGSLCSCGADAEPEDASSLWLRRVPGADRCWRRTGIDALVDTGVGAKDQRPDGLDDRSHASSASRRPASTLRWRLTSPRPIASLHTVTTYFISPTRPAL